MENADCRYPRCYRRAGLAGAARPTVNRVLREEHGRGTIRLERGKTIILNADELARHAGLPPAAQ